MTANPSFDPREYLEPRWRNLALRPGFFSSHISGSVKLDANVRERAKQLEEALRYFQEQVGLARRTALFDGQDPTGLALLDATYAGRDEPFALTSPDAIWERITSDALILACHGYQLLRDLRRTSVVSELSLASGSIQNQDSTATLGTSRQPDSSKTTGRSWRRARAEQRTTVMVRKRAAARLTVYALREAMYARLCYLRAVINRGTVNSEIGIPPLGDAVVALRRLNDAFDRQVRRWRIRRDLRGELEAGNATAYKVWSQQLGNAFEGEPNWGIFIRSMTVELRYRNHLMELRQRWHEISPASVQGAWIRRLALTPVRFLRALSLQVFRLVAGLGLRPARFAMTSIVTILAFSIAFGLDDWLSSDSRTLEPLGRYVYYAVVYLTSVGADHAPSGVAAPTLIAIESLIGYFLLSVLAATFFIWLTER